MTSKVVLSQLPTIKQIVQLYKLRAQKQLSQNFILDNKLCTKIVKKAGKLEDAYVCEVGPGPGGLTRAIIELGAKHLSVIEKDERFFPSLKKLNEASGGKMTLYHGDVLRFNMHDVFPDEIRQNWEDAPPKAHIIGNLPFAVSTPLIIRWLREISLKEGAWSKGRVKLTLTFQKEVAERMVAEVMKDNRCRLSVMCQNWCYVDHKFTIPGKAFVPAPEVDVGVVQFVPRVKPCIDAPFEYVEKMLRHVFHFRQKMCKRGIQTLFPVDRPEMTKRLIDEAEIHPDSTSFALSIEDYGRMCGVYKKMCDEEPGLFEYDFRSKETAAIWRTSSKSLGF